MSLMIGEPVELRERMRILAAVAPDQVRQALAEEVAIIAAEHLETVGSVSDTSPDIAAACRSYQRELWLWLVGERRWDHCLSGLSGRLSRRVAVVVEGPSGSS